MRRFAVVAFASASFAVHALAAGQSGGVGAAAAGSASAIASASASASASAIASESPKEQAREHFARGIALFAEESWDAALVEFVQSRALFPTRNATKNAALCLRQLHRFDEALDMFEALVREFPDMPPEARALVEKEMRELQTLVGKIQVRSPVAGATVVIDGRVRGAVPMPASRVSVGTHVVRVLADAYRAFEAQVQVAGAQTVTVDADLVRLEQAGRLRVVEAAGQSADVVVDGAVVGKTPWEGTLSVGDHVVALDGPGNLGTPPTRAKVSLGQSTPITLTVEALDARMRIEPNPAVASVALDGVVLGRGVWEGKVRSGAHRIEASAEAFLPATKDVNIGAGRSVVAVALEPDPQASLTFREAQAARKAWLARSGFLFNFEVRGQGTLLFLPNAPTRAGYVYTRADGSVEDARSDQDELGGGGSGGVGVRAALMYLALPDPAVGKAWHAVRLGTGVDANFGYWFTRRSNLISSDTNPDTGTRTDRYGTGTWGTGFMLNVPATLGYQLGIGSFAGRHWTGAVLGLAYTPSLSVLWAHGADSIRGFRWASFEASIDIIDKPMLADQHTAHGKFFVYVILPSGDAPLIMNFGGGASWY